MKKYEKEEIAKLPSKYKPVGAWKYFGYNILFAIPVIGWICLIVFACSGKNIVRRSYARSYFCVFFIVLLIVGIGFAVLEILIATGVTSWEVIKTFIMNLISQVYPSA